MLLDTLSIKIITISGINNKQGERKMKKYEIKIHCPSKVAMNKDRLDDDTVIYENDPDVKFKNVDEVKKWVLSHVEIFEIV